MRRLLSRPLRLSPNTIIATKTLLHVFLLGYLSLMFYQGVTDNLGADPVEALLHFTGISAVNLLMLTLSISPLASHLPCGDLIKFRRLLGVYAFVFALSHFLTYVLFELGMDLSLVGSEIAKRPYITVGFSALLLLLALALTSFDRIRARMGKRWQTLHNAIYLIILLALLHYSWSLKTALREPLFYWAGALFLLYFRKPKLDRWRKQRKK